MAGGLHLNHGPIDLIVEAFGAEDEVRTAHAQAIARFDGLLESLAAELPNLRMPLDEDAFACPVAQRMARAVAPHRNVFVTPMAAVAGAVADEMLAAMVAGRALERAYVNNGGDIALHLSTGAHFTAAMAGGTAEIAATETVRGIATSGWRGRSHSLGIADSVTVLARDAAAADVAATLIANAVDLPGHPAVTRGPARDEAPDSDLGERLITLCVGALSDAEIARALDAGHRCATGMRAGGMIEAAALLLGNHARMTGRIAFFGDTSVELP